MSTFHRTQSQISIEEVTQAEFDEINYSLDTLGVVGKATNVRNIAAAHQIQAIDGKIVTFDTSKEGYD